jgi:hypothetical protein
MHAVMQGISQIGVVTGHLRSGSAKTGFDEPHRRQILSLLENASKTLRNIPECSEADHVASSIVEAAHELVGVTNLTCTFVCPHFLAFFSFTGWCFH